MFNWKAEYSVGVTIIDDQHKKLFQMGQAMSELVTNHAGEDIYDELNAMFVELVDYTKYHFSEEEELMAQVKHANIAHHKIQHQKFVDKLNDLDFEAMDQDQGKFALNLLKTVATWIFKHITAEDFLYRDDMKNL